MGDGVERKTEERKAERAGQRKGKIRRKGG
jgi:hypothetical protein